MFPYDASLNTYEPLYEFSTGIPDWRAWNNTFIYGTTQLMIYLTDVLALLLTGKATGEI